MTVESVWPLALLAVIPLLWWVSARTLTNFKRAQVVLLTAVRSIIVTLAALALMRPAVVRPARDLSVVYAVDLSASVAPEGIAATADWIDAANRRGAPDHWTIVGFGGDTAIAGEVGLLRAFGAASPARAVGPALAVDRGATDIAAALDEALRRFAPQHLRRLVLVTDGRATGGDLEAAVARLQHEGVRVYTRVVASREAGDAWVEGLEAPDRVAAGEAFTADVVVYSQVSRSGTVELQGGGRTLETKRVALAAGETRVTFETTLAEPGGTAIEARLTVAGDPIPENNRFRHAIAVANRARVLYVEGRPRSARYLARALDAGGFDVDVYPPEALPERPAALEPYDAVVLSDIPRARFGDRQMEAVAAYVSERGGGLVLAGGEAVYGKDGYANTPLERILPVTFTVEDEPEDVAIVIVLDKSWSMVGPKIELSKEASKAAIDVLETRHYIGLVAFNHGADWVFPVQRASEKDRLKMLVSAVEPSSHTNIYPALEEAYLALQKLQSRVKHVILLSDGRTYPDDYEGLVGRMSQARITVSSVAVGEEADRELLGNIAKWGKGRAYAINNATEVPQIFTQETRRAVQPTLVEEAFRVVVRKPVELFKGLDLAKAPALLGYTSTQAKDTAEVLLASNRDDPILVRWQHGLGRAVLFASDVKDRWAANWLGWSGYGKFWTQLLRETMRDSSDAGATVRVSRRGDRARVEVSPADAEGWPGGAAPRIEAVGPDARTAVVAARPTASGAFEATIRLAEAGDYEVRVQPATGGAEPVSRSILFSYPDEYRYRPPDEALLRAISRDTGGVFEPDVADLLRDQDEPAPRPHDLWPWLAGLGAALYLADLALRRVRLFDR